MYSCLRHLVHHFFYLFIVGKCTSSMGCISVLAAAAASDSCARSGSIFLLFFTGLSDLWVAPIIRTECRVNFPLAHLARRLLATLFCLIAWSVLGAKSRRNCS